VVWTPLSAAELRRAARRVARLKPQAVAVALLTSYARPAHERRVERALARLGVPVTSSSRLSPEIREYERTATTVIDAYLAPRVGRYLEGLARGTAARIEIMLSHGGTAPPRAVAAARTLLSGPAAGAVAALDRALALGFTRALSLDVGGTSTDVAFLPGRLERRRDRSLGGFPVRLPLVDVHTVGAGGGSIARLDAGGLLEVGPQSAGAEPGPACYGRGGPPTVTDALLVLGRIVPDLFAGGERALDPGAARRALNLLGARMKRRAGSVAEGMVRVVNANMEAALRLISVERGHDPRGAALVAFGGAGGLHACELAESLGLEAVLWPRFAGLLSACGLVGAETRHERTRTVLAPVATAERLEPLWRELEREVRGEFRRDGEPAPPRLERWAEMRYRGQSHELSVPWGPDLEERFHRAHQVRYGHAHRGRVVEVVTLESRGSRPSGRAVTVAPPRASKVRPWGATSTWNQGRIRAVPVWRREELPRGLALRGPALLVEYGASAWLPSGWRARVAGDGGIVMTRSAAR
jgi:N-methylhydantoinase A